MGMNEGVRGGLLCVAAAVPAAPVWKSGAAETAAATQKKTGDPLLIHGLKGGNRGGSLLAAVRGGGFTTLDGAAVVLGASVAAVHVRSLAVVAEGHPGPVGWVFIWMVFAGLAVTAAGPFVFLGRRYLRRQEGYPRVGDGLWLVLGIPWLLSAPLYPEAVYAPVLSLSLAVACLTSLIVVWRAWVFTTVKPPRPEDENVPGSWTERIGLILAVAWPIQCGFGLVVLGS